MIKKNKNFPPTKQRLVKVGLNPLDIKTVLKARKNGDNDLIDKLYRLKSFFGYNRFNSLTIDQPTSDYPTSNELDLYDDIYISLFNINPRAQPISVKISDSKSKSNYSKSSYKQAVLNFSRSCRLSGLCAADVRREVDAFKVEYWKV